VENLDIDVVCCSKDNEYGVTSVSVFYILEEVLITRREQSPDK